MMSKQSHLKHEHKNSKKHHSDRSFEKPHEDYKAGPGGDVIIGILIVGLGLFFIVPFYPYLSSNALIAVISAFLLVVVLFGFFVWRKRKAK